MRLSAIIFTVIAATTSSGVVTQDESSQRSDELHVLDRFVGTWDIRMTVEPAEGESSTFDSVSYRSLSRGGKYVVFDDPQGEEFHMPLTYDAETKTYPGVMMAGKTRGLVTGTWDKDTNTMTFHIKNTDKSTYHGSHRFIRDDYAEASGEITDADGNVVLKLVGKQTRRKESTAIASEPAQRFDHLVREDLFAGFRGDKEALQRGLKKCEETLVENPRHAEALVWRGAARVFMSGQAFQNGDTAAGMSHWASGLKDMDDALELAPDNIGVLIPRAAVMLPAGRNAPPALGRPILMKVRADFERTYERQKDVLDQLGTHPLGELRMGLADVYRLLDQPVKSKEQLTAIVKDLPGTAYSARASKWLAASPEKKLAHSCIGCHTK